MNAVSGRMHRRLAVFTFAAALLGSLILVAPPANAATAVTIAPRVITGIPAAPEPGQTINQKVVKLDTISTPIAAGKTAYIYSKLKAYDSAHVNLVDNEILCSGAGSGNVVLGENIDPPTGLPDRQNIEIINRFLVTATSSGTLTCDIYLRTISLSTSVSSLTVSGELKFAHFDVKQDASGSAIQVSKPYTNPPTPVASGSPVYVSQIDRTLPAGYSSVAVIADTEFQSCLSGCDDSGDVSVARFTLYVHQMNGETICASAPLARLDLTVNKQTHHKAVPLYTTVTVQPGCNRLYAYVKVEYLSGYVGGIQGLAPNLTGVDPSGPRHDSAMTHAFAVPADA